MTSDLFRARKSIPTQQGPVDLFSLKVLEDEGLVELNRLPFSIRILLEAVLRGVDGRLITEQDVKNMAAWDPRATSRPNLPFLPARVIMQDLTGVPAIVDLAAMRSAMARLGGDPELINPLIPVDLVVDHSLQVDFFASTDALKRNAEIEFQRNRERFEFLRWGQEAFSQFRVVPPATGIVHQVNLEFLAKVVMTRNDGDSKLAFPDTLVGTDSHTTMINGLGVLGWGVGGIEAEAVILGQPLVMLAPEVIGFRLTSKMKEGTTATDLVLTITQILRTYGVVGKFVEFFGPGLAEMPLPDRATIANMSPEYGATVGFFPVDVETLRYMELTGRSAEEIDLVERYCKEQGLFMDENSPEPSYTDVIELDLSTIETSLAGPKRPQDRIPLSQMKNTFKQVLTKPILEGGFGLTKDQSSKKGTLRSNGTEIEVGHGLVVIAAITSCTNTSNPAVMVGAGLLAKKAVERGLQVKPYVKTSLAPGSTVVTEYLGEGGLLKPLAELGFNVVGYGCTTCIGNSGPLPGELVKVINETDLISVAILSGNRNFEGRINPHVRANYLASPPLVVAYALAGRTDLDIFEEPLGEDTSGQPVYLREIWPSQAEVQSIVERTLKPDIFKARYSEVFSGNDTWNAIPQSGISLYPWESKSTYIQEPPFFEDLTAVPAPVQDIENARVLVVLGDSVTTDHISPAGAIPVDSPAGEFLIDLGTEPRDFNTFGARRGNDKVMIRGTFGNIRLKNLLLPGVEGGETLHFPDGEQMSIYKAAMKYKDEKVPLIVLAGEEYGSGSSRDWAAKGTLLLGGKAVIAKSFERIHRSNLIGMGVLPLEFTPGEGLEPLGLTGHEVFSIRGLSDDLLPGKTLLVSARREDGTKIEFETIVRIDTETEAEYYRNGGILHTVLRQMLHQT